MEESRWILSEMLQNITSGFHLRLAPVWTFLITGNGFAAFYLPWIAFIYLFFLCLTKHTLKIEIFWPTPGWKVPKIIKPLKIEWVYQNNLLQPCCAFSWICILTVKYWLGVLVFFLHCIHSGYEIFEEAKEYGFQVKISVTAIINMVL